MFREVLKSGLRKLGVPGTGALEGLVAALRRRQEGPQSGADRGGNGAARGGDVRSVGEMSVREVLAEDFATYDRDVVQPGFWAVLVHRFGTRIARVDVPVVGPALDATYRALHRAVDWKWGINLPRTVELGRRVRIWHTGCMLLNARSIGDDVHLRQMTTLGPVAGMDPRPGGQGGGHGVTKGASPERSPGPLAADSSRGPVPPEALPVIESGADIGSGSVILGAVTIGREALVGANSVVLEDVPPHVNVLGVPARTVPGWSIGTRSNAMDGTAKDAGKPLPLGDRNENPPGIGIGALLAEDFRTHGGRLASAGFWALAVHRIGNWRMGIRAKAMRAPMTLLYRAAHHGIVTMWGIDLPYNAKLGRRLLIGHHGAVLMGAREVGDDVQIRSAVTVGLRRRSDPAAPTIGNRVRIESNACIIGNIHVGDDAVIGPNTVLARDVPPGSTMLGIPGRRINPLEYVRPR